MNQSQAPLLHKPSWLKARIPGGPEYSEVKRTVQNHQLHTVCQSASCPNLGECWARGTATFMILGNTCTRGCRFCDVPKGRPSGYDREEPARVAESVRLMGLRYAVITSVTRDDLPDQGAEVWADTLRAVREASPACRVEALIPDMQGRQDLLDIIFAGKPNVLNHNLETVQRLQRPVRGRADWVTSSSVLRYAKSKGFVTKTSFMLGLGETMDEVQAAILHCASLQVDIVTFGQYLQPSREHLAVDRFVPPEEFHAIREFALENGIRYCVSGPMVRSSYLAETHAPGIIKENQP